MDVKPVLFLVGGVLVLVFCLWSYLGRSRAARWWARQRGPMGMWHEQSVLAIWPACGLAMAVVGGGQLVDARERFPAVVVLMGLVCILLGLWGGFRIPIPRWWMPRWYREMKPEKQQPNEKPKQSPIDLWGQE